MRLKMFVSATLAMVLATATAVPAFAQTTKPDAGKHDTAKGALAGAVVGHEVGHGHALAGAAVGAAVGHHEKKKAEEGK